MQRETAIILEDLSFSLDGKQILSSINLEFKKGEFVGLVGPNGAGKTTLLKSINGLNQTKGKVYLIGGDSKKMSGKKLARQIALMKQDTEVSFPFSAWEIVVMGRYPHLGWDKQEKEEDRKIARKYMEYTKTLSLANKRISALSGGERQRVMFAKVLTQETPIILLDEPTSNLDMAHQEQLFSYGREFCQQGGTIVAAIHDLRLAARYCNRLVLLKKGRIIAQGFPEEVLTAKSLKEAYGVETVIYRSQVTGEYDIYLPSFAKEKPNQKIHLIGGGGTATALLREFYQQGYQLTMGVIAYGDSDLESAKIFQVNTISNPPFTPITSEAHQANVELIREADWVILCSLPFGQDNLDNLRAATHASKLIIIEDSPIQERDYTGGEAIKLYKKLREKAVVLPLGKVKEIFGRMLERFVERYREKDN